MKDPVCTECGKPAMRQGTKGRFYCFAHDSNAFDQARLESRRMSVVKDAMAEQWMKDKFLERQERGW
jgi:hypothetical protein